MGKAVGYDVPLSSENRERKYNKAIYPVFSGVFSKNQFK